MFSEFRKVSVGFCRILNFDSQFGSRSDDSHSGLAATNLKFPRISEFFSTMITFLLSTSSESSDLIIITSLIAPFHRLSTKFPPFPMSFIPHLFVFYWYSFDFLLFQIVINF